MHIVIGLLTTVVTLLWLLHRLAEMGIDLGGLNPFYWKRRREWAKKYEGDPIYAVEDPMEVAALFVVAIAKLEGDVTAEQKADILGEFSSSFSLTDKEASQLLGSSTHLLGHPQIIRTQLEGLMQRNEHAFTREQAESLITMMSNAIASSPAPSEEQAALITSMRERFVGKEPQGGTWT